MTTKSQEAFEKHYLGYHNIVDEDFSKTDGLYNMSYLHRDFEKWQAGVEYGRKQALEEAVEIAKTMRDFYGKPSQPLSANEIVNTLERLIK